MKIYQSILTYLLLFLSLSVVLKFFGLIHFTGSEIISYALIFYGISVVYNSLGKNRKYMLFFGTIIFLTGILLFIINNFLIFWNADIFVPSALFIPGIAFLMLFVDEPRKSPKGWLSQKFLIISLVLIVPGLFVTIINGQFNISSFYEAIIKIISYYWPVALIAVGILILIFFEERK